jgi:hypothetical protein
MAGIWWILMMPNLKVITGRGNSPYPPPDRARAQQQQIWVPRRLAEKIKAYAERLAWETVEKTEGESES